MPRPQPSWSCPPEITKPAPSDEQIAATFDLVGVMGAILVRQRDNARAWAPWACSTVSTAHRSSEPRTVEQFPRIRRCVLPLRGSCVTGWGKWHCGSVGPPRMDCRHVSVSGHRGSADAVVVRGRGDTRLRSHPHAPAARDVCCAGCRPSRLLADPASSPGAVRSHSRAYVKGISDAGSSEHKAPVQGLAQLDVGEADDLPQGAGSADWCGADDSDRYRPRVNLRGGGHRRPRAVAVGDGDIDASSLTVNRSDCPRQMWCVLVGGNQRNWGRKRSGCGYRGWFLLAATARDHERHHECEENRPHRLDDPPAA